MVVIADATQIRQLLINLVVNARDAVAGEGRIGVELRVEAVGESRTAELLVVDDGCGMDATTRDQVFEPFYTTKGPGGGTGLGLAVAYGAVQAHGGRIDVETAPGQGTTFRVRLPMAEAAALAPWDEAASLDAREGETILVADDELVVRRLVRVALERHGYKVVEVASGEEAVACLADDPEGIDLAVLDLTMPGLDGLATLERLRTFRSGLPAVVMSGLLGAGPSFPVPDAVGLLPKPFSADEMARVIRACLDGATGQHRPGAG